MVTTIVQVISSPNLGFLLDTNLIISKSTSGSTSVVLLALLFSVLLSGVVEFTTATFVIVALVMFTVVVITKLADLPFAKSPTVQIPVVLS